MNKVLKIFLVVIVFFITHSLVYSQAVTWQKWYDYNNFEESGDDVIQTFDGGYIILSNIYTSITRSVVTKTDQFGMIEWQRLYDVNNIGGFSLYLSSVTQARDSGYIITGNNQDSAIIFRINKSGDVKWIKKYFGRSAGFLDHKVTNDGGILACGYLFNPSIGCVIKTDSMGNKLWDALYSFTTDIFVILESKDNSFYILGIDDSKENAERTNKHRYNLLNKHSTNARGVVMASLTKANDFGKVIWKENLFLPNAINLIEHPSGHIFVGGGLDSMILYKIDTSSSVIFQKSYYKGVNGCGSMCLSKDENILMVGGQYVNNYQAFLMAVSKIDPNGNLIFNKLIPSLTNDSNFAFLAHSVNATNDFGFIFTGFTDYPPSFHESNIFASKTDSLCNAPYMVNIKNNNLLLPEKFNLYQNYPNPFNPATTISYSIPVSGFVKLKVYDITGKEILLLVNEVKEAGRYEIQFDGSSLASGVYFYKLEAGSFISTRRMVLIK